MKITMQSIQTIEKPLPQGWRWVKLGEVTEINPRRPKKLGRLDDAPTTFIPMSAVDEINGVILRPEIKPFSEVHKGYTYFSEGDVLFAKITPCMQNGKHAIATNLIDGIGFGSTEFHFFRPSTKIYSDFIHLFLRQPSILSEAQAHFTGAVGQQRVPEQFLASLEIPLPPLPEQQRIAARLREQMQAVDEARQAAQAQLQAINQLPAALLRQAFSGAV
jgi:type I restriction enzyme S subunit